MKSAKLEIVIHCAKGLKDVKHFSRMNPVATVWVAGDGLVSKKKTPVAEKGDCNPKWECSMHFDITSINTNYILFFKLEHCGSWTQRLIGEVQVPFEDLLKGDAQVWCRAAYPVTIPYGRKQGEIIFSRKFSELVVSSSSSNKNDGSGTSKSTHPTPPPQPPPPRRENLGNHGLPPSRENPEPPPRGENPGPPPRRENPGEVSMIGMGVHQEAGKGMAAGIAEGITDGVATAATTALLKEALDGVASAASFRSSPTLNSAKYL